MPYPVVLIVSDVRSRRYKPGVLVVRLDIHGIPAAYSRVSVSLRKHELYSVDLVYLGSAGVEVHGYDIALRVLSAQLSDNALAGNVVRQAGKRLYAHDVRNSLADELQHFR